MLTISKIFRPSITSQFRQVIPSATFSSVTRSEPNKPEQCKEIAKLLFENKDDIETLKYLIKYKFGSIILRNYVTNDDLKNVIFNHDSVNSIFFQYKHDFYQNLTNANSMR